MPLHLIHTLKSRMQDDFEYVPTTFQRYKERFIWTKLIPCIF